MAAAAAMCAGPGPFSFFDKGSNECILVDDFHSKMFNNKCLLFWKEVFGNILYAIAARVPRACTTIQYEGL